MKLNPLTVGPIIRATYGNSMRRWGRGDYQPTSRSSQEPKWCVVMARIGFS